MKDFLIGTDPEVFLSDMQSGKIASGIGIVGGSKEDPIDIGENCFIQEDNILAEFNIPPTGDKDTFIKNINYCKDYISTLVAGKGLKLKYSSSEMVDDSVLSSEEAKKFGCSPSYNVLTETIHAVEGEFLPDYQKNLRTSGFHIHYGWKFPSDYNREKLVLCHELNVTMPLVSVDSDKHHRREFYGMFGDCRYKDYGVECRSLGGYFIKDDYTLSLVWRGIEKTIKLFNSSINVTGLKEMVSYAVGDNNKLILANYREVINDLKESKTIKI